MDEQHTLMENFNKVSSLIEAINIIHAQRNDVATPILVHEVDSLKALSDEASESLKTLKKVCITLHTK